MKRVPFGVRVERKIERLGMAFAAAAGVGTGMLGLGVVTTESYRSRQIVGRFLRAIYMLSMHLRLDLIMFGRATLVMNM